MLSESLALSLFALLVASLVWFGRRPGWVRLAAVVLSAGGVDLDAGHEHLCRVGHRCRARRRRAARTGPPGVDRAEAGGRGVAARARGRGRACGLDEHRPRLGPAAPRARRSDHPVPGPARLVDRPRAARKARRCGSSPASPPHRHGRADRRPVGPGPPLQAVLGLGEEPGCTHVRRVAGHAPELHVVRAVRVARAGPPAAHGHGLLAGRQRGAAHLDALLLALAGRGSWRSWCCSLAGLWRRRRAGRHLAGRARARRPRAPAPADRVARRLGVTHPARAARQRAGHPRHPAARSRAAPASAGRGRVSRA